MLEIYLIRHAESENNRLVKRIREEEGVDASSSLYNEFKKKRQSDPPITQLGRDQCRLLASLLTKQDGERARLFSSCFRRALSTASLLSSSLQLPVQLWPEIHEIGGIYLSNRECKDRGIGRGKLREEFPNVLTEKRKKGREGGKEEEEGEGGGLTWIDKVAFESFNKTVDNDGWWPKERGRESMQEAMGRAIQVTHQLRKIARKSGERRERLFLVSHGDFLNLLTRSLLSILPGNRRYFHHDNTGVSCFIIDSFEAMSGNVRCMFFNRLPSLSIDQSSFASMTAKERKQINEMKNKQKSKL